MKILVTGGAGYIGSHTCVELLNNEYDLVVIDNLSNSKKISLDRVREITEKDFLFYKTDLLDKNGVKKIFDDHPDIKSVIHFAGLKAVGESVEKPLYYYNNNIVGTLNLLGAMGQSGVKNIVFSSSATVYGDPHTVPIQEHFPLGATNPYGCTKQYIEQILSDIHRSDHNWNICSLRYFNPIGAHVSGKIGEDPSGIPNNLLPFISQVAVGKREKLYVFGDDYPTKDGSGVRDYIHVVDLAYGHVKAVEKTLSSDFEMRAINLGTGKGYSVFEIIDTFSKVSGKKIPYEVTARRPGDIAHCYADPSLAHEILNWRAEKDLETMCLDTWRWQSKNPQGYS